MNENQTNEFFNHSSDPLYQKVRQEVTGGHRLPYKEYLKRRTIHFIERVADEQEIADIETAIKNRGWVEPKSVNHDQVPAQGG